MQSKGFLALCEQKGLTDELIVDSLTEDIKLKPQNRLGELTLAAKIKGLLTDKNEVREDVKIEVVLGQPE